MAKNVPRLMRKIVVNQLGNNFAQVTKLIDAPVPELGVGEVLVHNKYVGINASDVNYTAGRYDPTARPPFDAGFEGLGQIVAAGENTGLKVGQPVVYLDMGAFAEYKVVRATQVVPLPDMDPQYLPFMLSGLTAAISLDKVGEVQKGNVVLVTAAAGGTGQFAVQWCKNIGCTVIGTCSSDEKVQFLKSIGCDRPVNYKKEDVGKVLKAEYPKGVDVVYESVGGAVFETCLQNLAVNGRLIVIGAISSYATDFFSGFKASSMLPLILLRQSASVRGFFLMHHAAYFREYMQKLVAQYKQGRLTSAMDFGDSAPGGRFVGLETVSDAVQYMFAGKNIGKVIVQVSK